MASLSRGKIIEKDKRMIDALTERGFGIREESTLIITPVESLYLLEKNKIEIKMKNKKIGAKEISKIFGKKDALLEKKFFILKELRGCGFISRAGLRDDFLRVYDRGVRPGEGKSRWLVKILREDEKFGARELEDIVGMAGRVRKELVLAVVGARGEMLYYKIGRKTW